MRSSASPCSSSKTRGRCCSDDDEPTIVHVRAAAESAGAAQRRHRSGRRHRQDDGDRRRGAEAAARKRGARAGAHRPRHLHRKSRGRDRRAHPPGAERRRRRLRGVAGRLAAAARRSLRRRAPRVRDAARAHRQSPLADDPLVLPDAAAAVPDRGRPRPPPPAARVAVGDPLLRHAGYLFQIRAAVLALLDRRDLLQDETLDAGDVAEFEDALQEAVDEIRANGDDDSRITRYVRENAQRPRGLDAWIDYLGPIANDIRTEKLGKKNSRDAMKMLRWGDIGDSAYDRLVSHRAAVALLALARRFIAFLDDEKRKLGVVDFDDLLLRTAALLENDDVLARVRRQFDYVFVDEFQDTDRVQARILERLGHGTTIVVGDPKQSIYGFRRADPETYGAFTRRLVDGGAEYRVIRDQYRSHPALLNAFNSMFAALFENAAPDPNVFRPEYPPLVAAKSGEPRDAHITFLHGGENSLAEAEQIAEWIAARGGELRRYAILLRRTAKLDDYLDALQR